MEPQRHEQELSFAKYHALGNDYLVMDAARLRRPLGTGEVIQICHRNYGIGSDGILLYEGPNDSGQHRLKIYNPDGSEAEKSGNGLRIFARYLFDRSLVEDQPFKVVTAGGIVECEVLNDGREVSVQMGRVSFDSAAIPVEGDPREVIREQMNVLGRELEFSAATVGNPHCVVITDKARAEDAKHYGPHIEKDRRFPNRTNVQFVEVVDRQNIRIEIWERGAGYTLASGSSSSAAAAVAFRLGLTDGDVTVHMPGGTLTLQISPDFDVRMRGAVTRVASGSMKPEIFSWRIPAEPAGA